jgi:serine/threonine protein kinase
MFIVNTLCALAVRHYMGESADRVVAALLDHVDDHSLRVTRALHTANDRAWRALELALAGDSWWDRFKGKLARREDQALAQQIRAFLDANPLREFAGQPGTQPQLCLRDLQAARQAGHLNARPEVNEVARQVQAFKRYHDSEALVKQDMEVIGQLAAHVKGAGFAHLSWLLELQVQQGTSLLLIAVRYYFRRAMEEDRELFQGFTFEKLEGLSEAQEKGFLALQAALVQQAARLDEMLSLAVETRDAAVAARDAAQAGHEAVLDLKAEMERQIQALGQQYQTQFQQFYQPIIQMLDTLQLQSRPVRASDSMSIRTPPERQRAQELLKSYLALPAEQRRGRPALLNGLGQLGYALNDFDNAHKVFAEAATVATDHRAKAEAHYNAYRAALERQPARFDEALDELRRAMALDQERFAPFPLDDYEPLRILGAGGFGVTFLCRHSLSHGEVAIKALTTENLDRDVTDVFQEAGILEQLQHPCIIRLRDCKFADRARTRPYLIMEYFPGQTLEDYVHAHGPLPLKDYLHVARLLVKGLHAAHAKGILHRDVKPANILVRRDGHNWRLKVIDFGLALKPSSMAHASTARQQRTRTGNTIAGTVDYAAPEQLGHLPGVSVGRQADVYGFAKTSCFALFQMNAPRIQEWEKVPRPLAGLLGECLAERPEQRPANFAAVYQRLEAVSEAEAALPVAVPLAEPPKSQPGKSPSQRSMPPALPPEVKPAKKPQPAAATVKMAPFVATAAPEDDVVPATLAGDEMPARPRLVPVPRGAAEGLVRPAAMALLIVAIVGAVSNLLIAIIGSFGGIDHTADVIALLFCLSSSAVSGIAIPAALQMRKLRNHTFAVVGSIAVMYGACDCILAGVGIGIWCLIVLFKPEVKAAFH